MGPRSYKRVYFAFTDWPIISCNIGCISPPASVRISNLPINSVKNKDSELFIDLFLYVPTVMVFEL